MTDRYPILGLVKFMMQISSAFARHGHANESFRHDIASLSLILCLRVRGHWRTLIFTGFTNILRLADTFFNHIWIFVFSTSRLEFMPTRIFDSEIFLNVYIQLWFFFVPKCSKIMIFRGFLRNKMLGKARKKKCIGRVSIERSRLYLVLVKVFELIFSLWIAIIEASNFRRVSVVQFTRCEKRVPP